MDKPVIAVPDTLPIPDTPGTRECFRVQAAADRTVIELYDDLWPWEVTRLLSSVREAKSKAIDFRMNCFGGDGFGGVAVYNALARHSARVRVDVEGVAASAASIIAMAGDEIRMGKGAFMMIHEAHAVSAGRAEDMEVMAGLLRKVNDQLADIYADRSGLPKAEVVEMMAAETWMTADEAIEKGFADSLNGQAKIAAHADLSRYRNAPAQLLAHAQEAQMTTEQIKAAIAALDDERSLRGIASNVGNRIRQLAQASASPTPDPSTPQPETPPAPAADAPKADTPDEGAASALQVEATHERIRRLLGRDNP